MRFFKPSKAYLCFATLFMASMAHGQIAHNCGPLAATDFKLSTVVARAAGIDEPIKMTFDTDAQGNVDIFWVERLGKVKKYLGASKTVITLGEMDFYAGYEDGVTGIALDPGFKTNKMLYIYYSQGTTAKFNFRVSRFVLNAQGLLDMPTEKIIIEIPAIASHMHTGGAMVFDAKGDLWITTGENQSGEEGPPNTNDLRGKILRIHPKADGTYGIPEGNLFKEGTLKTRPEIYIMGCRNPYSISLDAKRNGVTWGDIGPDGKGLTEEHNFATAPGNYGYPYFAGNNILLMGTGTAAAPVNNNTKNTGLVQLPPAIPAIDAYQQQAATTGPVYRYNASANSPVKFPPHFDGVWFVTDFQTGNMDTISLNAAGTAKVGQARVFPTMHFDRPIDMQMGPDGALYIINYAGWFGPAATTSIQRIEYSGTCRPAVDISPNPQKGGNIKDYRFSDFSVSGMSIEVFGISGAYSLSIQDLQGRQIANFQGSGPNKYDLSEKVGHRPGLYLARFSHTGGVSAQTILLN
jgi:cytochrome c